MNEMLERVARAICKSVDGRNPDHLIAVYEDRPLVGGGIMIPIHKRDWENYLTQARAAIAAMREPTNEMFLAMEQSGVSFQTQQRMWPAVVDVMLKP